jgi:hypothetical protein
MSLPSSNCGQLILRSFNFSSFSCTSSPSFSRSQVCATLRWLTFLYNPSFSLNLTTLQLVSRHGSRNMWSLDIQSCNWFPDTRSCGHNWRGALCLYAFLNIHVACMLYFVMTANLMQVFAMVVFRCDLVILLGPLGLHLLLVRLRPLEQNSR